MGKSDIIEEGSLSLFHHLCILEGEEANEGVSIEEFTEVHL